MRYVTKAADNVRIFDALRSPPIRTSHPYATVPMSRAHRTPPVGTDLLRVRAIAVRFTKRRIEDLCRANWTRTTRLVTLTCRPDARLDTRPAAVAAVRDFARRLRRAGFDCRYLAVAEKHKKGDYHVHLLWFDYKASPGFSHVTDAWQRGHVDVTRIPRDRAAYVAKYVGKDVDDVEDGGARYVRSRNLREPVRATAADTQDAEQLALWWLSHRLPTSGVKSSAVTNQWGTTTYYDGPQVERLYRTALDLIRSHDAARAARRDALLEDVFATLAATP